MLIQNDPAGNFYGMLLRGQQLKHKEKRKKSEFGSESLDSDNKSNIEHRSAKTIVSWDLSIIYQHFSVLDVEHRFLNLLPKFCLPATTYNTPIGLCLKMLKVKSAKQDKRAKGRKRKWKKVYLLHATKSNFSIILLKSLIVQRKDLLLVWLAAIAIKSNKVWNEMNEKQKTLSKPIVNAKWNWHTTKVCNKLWIH